MTPPDKIEISRECAEYYRDFVNLVVRRAHDAGRTNLQAVPRWKDELEAALSQPSEGEWVIVGADHQLPDDLTIGDEVQLVLHRHAPFNAGEEFSPIAYRRASGER